MASEHMSRLEAERLVQEDPRLLSNVDQQRRFLARMHLNPVRCPNCEEPTPEVDAIHHKGDHYECPHCHAKLEYVVPLMAAGGSMWFWRLEPHQIKAEA